MKHCRKCGELKDLSEFRKTKTSHGYYKTCKSCCKAAVDPQKQAYAYWKSGLKQKYGVTPDWYYETLSKQGGVCAICGTSNPGAKRLYFCVDHCHHTGEVRGLLCSSCNVGIGNLKDSPTLISQALEYLNGKPNGDDVQPQGSSKRRSTPPLEGVDL